ncbi:Uncharacterized protein OBRU01_16473 [Operophtera brumata]|uniref:DDE Tnp4 domain-containing protein n=1 Tax=Operophtera brumata TaxID=104452 RepID=A0A0L7L205_OPEBR|nr:Uncharacterized protein OBRU01_16473 [Operophtera brumata]
MEMLPSTDEEWKMSAKLFETQWHFNNCVGCMDGKHILIQKPPESGSLFFNYKGTFSVVLFAIVNANYEFIYVHTGSNGSQKKSKTYLTPTCVDREDLERGTFINGTWRQATNELISLQRNIQRPSTDGKNIRNTLTQYFNGAGSVTFQDRMIN